MTGRLLSEALGWVFFDADALHSPSNIEKMGRGIPLTGEDRRPWLDRLRNLIGEWLKEDRDVVLACSALTKGYRLDLRQNSDAVHFVYLKGSYPQIEGRLRERAGHFMNPALLKSQFDLLEEPEDGILSIDVRTAPAEVVQVIRNAFRI